MRGVDRAPRIVGRHGRHRAPPWRRRGRAARCRDDAAVMRGDPLGDRALARGRRAVDGDDHDKFAPSPRINSTKPGKLVAMKLASSTLTGFSLAKPHDQRGHGDAVIHVSGDEAAADGAALAMDNEVVAFDLGLDPVRAQHRGRGGEAVRFLHPQLLQSRASPSCPRRKRRRRRAPGIRRSSPARAKPAPRRLYSALARTRKSATCSPPSSRGCKRLDGGAHLAQRRRPGRRAADSSSRLRGSRPSPARSAPRPAGTRRKTDRRGPRSAAAQVRAGRRA